MSTAFVEFTEGEQRPVITFLWSECTKTSDTYVRITVQYDDIITSQRKVYKWVRPKVAA
jgi:hypothetical protein